MTVKVQDLEHHVPELANIDGFESVTDNADVIFSSTFGDIGYSDTFTLFVNREPDIHTAHVHFSYLMKLRPNHVFLTAAWANSQPWKVSNVNFCSNLVSTVRHNKQLGPVTVDNKKYDALCLFGGNTFFRNNMFLRMQEYGISENCLVNIHHRGRNQCVIEKLCHRSADVEKYDVPEFKKIGYLDDGGIFTMMPIEHNFWLSQKIPYDLYNLAYLNIVTETETNSEIHDLFYMSEKISKPLFLGMPFLVLGCQGYLGYLHELGFKTYGGLIDESYDDIENWLERSNAIIDIVKDFSQWSDTKKHSFLQKAYPISMHNRKLATDYQHWLQPVISVIKNSL
jgi:hypothetical protein